MTVAARYRRLRRRLGNAPARLARELDVERERWRHRARRRPSPRAMLAAAGGGQPVEALVASLRARDAATFFFAPGEAPSITAWLERADAGWRGRLLADAEAVLAHRVRLLGADRLELGARLPWHADPLAGYEWPARAYHKRVRIPYGEADIKVPWELSRCQHLPTLGMAYAATGDDRFAAEAVAQIDDWIARNPSGLGVNWACAMDAGIRAVNWLWTLHLVAGAAPADDAFLERLLASLLEHGRHVSANIETYRDGITTNHTTADYTALFFLGVLLPQLPESAGWEAAGRAGLEACMAAQVAPDGGDFENSIAYHRLVLEMFATAARLADRNGRPFGGDYRASLERMFEFVLHYLRPDGRAPLLGDSDDGRLQILARYFDWDPQDHRYLLGIGAELFVRDDFAAVAAGSPLTAEETAWLLGAGAAERVRRQAQAPVRRRSCAFAASGRFVMRHGEHFAIVAGDPVGTGGLGNHKHNDLLSFELSVGGVPVVVDPGTYLYTRDVAWRDRFRSTRAHNTVMVDGVEQNEMVDPFAMRTDAAVRVHAWSPGPDGDALDLEHTGYGRLERPVTHRRRILMLAAPFAFVVLDSLSGQGTHDVESFLHFDPAGHLEPAAAPDGVEAVLETFGRRFGIGAPPAPGAAGTFAFGAGDLRVAVVALGWPEAHSERGWAAPRYGRREPAPALRYGARLACDAHAGYVILPAT